MQLKLIYHHTFYGDAIRSAPAPWRQAPHRDMYKQLTAGCPVIMSQHTWERLPKALRPLSPSQVHMVTRQPLLCLKGARHAETLVQVLRHCRPAKVVWVLGRGELYHQAMPLIDEVVTLHVALAHLQDAGAPHLPMAHWREDSRIDHGQLLGAACSTVTYKRLYWPAWQNAPLTF